MNWKKLLALCTVLVPTLGQLNQTQYDVIVIGGGPSGLSAASGLSRVLRKVALFDSGEYRNNPTRHMHDVIGSDHVVPAEFRAKAREQISFYNVTTFIDAKVTSLKATGNGSFTATVENGTTFSARKVILGSGLKDDLPAVPGLREAFGKGIYWCPWCDGFEHRDQPLGVLGNLSDAYDSVRELHPTLNQDIRVFSNGTNNTAQWDRLAQKNPNWQAVFKAYNVTINDKAIANITRVQNGNETQDKALRKEFDKFRVYFTDGSYEERGPFMTNYGTSQASKLPQQLGVKFIGGKIDTSTNAGLRTSVKGVWGVGDANSDNSTNVPHGMASGKRAAVYCHVELATEEIALIGSNSTAKRGLAEPRAVEREMGSDVEDLYNGLRLK
ncbi:putative cytoplasmic thioredoxin reductase [Aspergillus karnatakaensis]|uniref:NAD(P)/FAD-dependent oxidoreductase n=1 Tax=Aspergillus karnatakaensis TaxID=1810916 RepID=UPI003CCCF5B4